MTSTTYKERPLTVQAVAVSKITGNLTLPNWATDKIISGEVVKLPDGTLTVKTPQGKRIGIDGDMLIQNLGGELSLMPAARFLAWYEKVGN